MIDSTLNEIRAHAIAEYPRESCGLVVIVGGLECYVPCRNIATTPREHFILSTEDYATAEEQGEIIAVVHSHPNAGADPSEADKVMCEASGLEWHIVRVWSDEGVVIADDIKSFQPNGYEAPLVGRTFWHGVLDCYTLIRDWYKRELGVTLPDYERRDNWWNNGENLYMDNFAAAGFSPIRGALQVGDIIIMQIRGEAPNHAGVYIGDGLILHHLSGRLSSRDVYGGYFQQNTVAVVRRNEA